MIGLRVLLTLLCIISVAIQICTVLAHAAKKERLDVPDHVNLLIARISEGNLRRALLSLEALSVQDPTFATISEGHSILTGGRVKPSELDSVPRPDWEKYAGKAAEKILQEQSPDKLLEVRGMLYELLVHCIPAPIILSVSRRSRAHGCYRKLTQRP